MKIQILDCTLRDGGYINDWAFSNKQIITIINSLIKAQCDIIECGYLNDKKGVSDNSTLFDSIQSLDNILEQFDPKVQKVVMINFGDFNVNSLPDKKDTYLDGIRLAFHKKDLETAIKQAAVIVSKGYKLFFQPMLTKRYTDIEFLSMIQQINKVNIYSFYIVDSFGSMTLDEFQRYKMLADHNLNTSIVLGYHSHNNMQLAYSNAINLCSSNLRRDVIVDASIYGIGRGAGNLNTELILDFLNKYRGTQYDTLPLLEVIDEFLNFLMKKNPWGFSPAQYLSALFECHPNYTTYLINKNTKHIVGIKKILERLPEEKRVSYDYKYINELYQESILEEKTPIKNNFTLPSNKKILLVASGKSVNEHRDIIQEKVEDREYILIALNHKPEFECDYYFFANQKRYDEFKIFLNPLQTIITNNISSDINVNSVLDFSKLAVIENMLISNVAVVTINYLISLKVKQIEIVGLDGYKLDGDNYNYNETAFVTDSNALMAENEILSEAFKELQKQIKIEFLSASLFKNITQTILGVIPARYKSSRFEGKPLCLIKNIPMIKRTYEQAKKSTLLDKLVVATESELIKNYCEQENIPVVMTSETCLTGTDRLSEVAQTEYFDFYVNIQGDEPVIDPKSIDEVVREFQIHGNEYMAYNLYKEIEDTDEITSSTIIKVIVNEKDELLYMSRLGVPFNKSNDRVKFKKQVCVYGFTQNALKVFSSRSKTCNEQFEDIEILRFVDMGYKVKMKETEVSSIAVDIPEDVAKVEKFLDENGLE